MILTNNKKHWDMAETDGEDEVAIDEPEVDTGEDEE